MRGTEIGPIINSILVAFSNATDVFKRVKGRKDTKKVQKSNTSADYRRLQDALESAPMQIRSLFDEAVAKHGKRFLVGDMHTQTSLAQILLDLNNGLMETITSMLAGRSRREVFPAQKLLRLLQQASTDTLRTMESFDERLSSRSTVVMDHLPNGKKKRSLKQSNAVKQVNGQSHEVASVPKSHPLLVRGGWIRTKSGDSIIVSAEGAQRRAARKSKSKHARAPISASMHKNDSRRANQTPPDFPDTWGQEVQQYSYKLTPHAHNTDNTAPAERAVLPSYEKQKPPSMYLVPADVFDCQSTTMDRFPVRPPKVPLHTRPDASSKPRPASGITFMTTSTKIGEIPIDRLPDHQLSEEELAHRPLPYTIPPPLLHPPSKSRKRFWRFKLKG